MFSDGVFAGIDKGIFAGATSCQAMKVLKTHEITCLRCSKCPKYVIINPLKWFLIKRSTPRLDTFLASVCAHAFA